MIFILITLFLFTVALFFAKYFLAKIIGQAQAVYFKYERNIFFRIFAANKLAVAKSKLDLFGKILSAISFVRIVFCLAVIVLTAFFIFTKLSGKC
ncbi:hypothetical protein [uncultured Treponema sp.]|uniref:hypothetical protein n=1 Tax=uncultured Treponema sp. TaxID=162155 RepID=UPI0025EC297F|nr:hypothetical protein [uncultured Treponema sp.]